MLVESPKNLFELMLSNALHDRKRAACALESLCEDREDRDIAGALKAQAFVVHNIH